MWLCLGIANSVRKDTEARKPLGTIGYTVYFGRENSVCDKE